jgi:hypothetical protein
MNALQLLDEHLVRIGSKLYPKSRVDRIYNKLNAPKTGVIYDGDRVKAYSVDGNEIGVATDYGDGFSVNKPYQPDMPPPYREMGGMLRQFNQYVQQNPGLYSARPASAEGYALSQRMGFLGDEARMYLDSRRFQNFPAVNELVGYKDAEIYGLPTVQRVAQVRNTPGYLSGGMERMMPAKKYTIDDYREIQAGGYINQDGVVIDRDGDVFYPF